MPGQGHLHIDQDDVLTDWISKALQSMKSGTIAVDFGGKPALKVDVEGGTMAVDLLKADVFRVPEDETGLFDKLKTAGEFGRKLSDNGMTLTFLRRGKEAVKLGKEAHPSLSRLITGSKDIQLTSIKEFNKLKDDLKTD